MLAASGSSQRHPETRAETPNCSWMWQRIRKFPRGGLHTGSGWLVWFLFLLVFGVCQQKRQTRASSRPMESLQVIQGGFLFSMIARGVAFRLVCLSSSFFSTFGIKHKAQLRQRFQAG
ncbi:hypothetical protein J3F83DRAFT_726879 [Trichoderma novae-zelandiae]